jgi:serine/threonine-protein kinase
VPPPPSSSGPGRVEPAARRSKLPAVLIGLAALVAAAVVVLAVLTRGPDALATPSTPTAGPSQDDLLAILPADFDASSCRPAPAADDGDVASVDCGASASQPGPGTSRIFLYPDEDALDAAFQGDVEQLGLTAFSNGAGCPASQGYGGWTADGQERGQVACYVDEENTSTLIWTEREFDAEAVIRIRNGGTAGLTSLWEWWQNADHSDFGA